MLKPEVAKGLAKFLSASSSSPGDVLQPEGVMPEVAEGMLATSSSSRAGELRPDVMEVGAKAEDVTGVREAGEVLEVVVGEEAYHMGQQTAEHVADLGELEGVELKWTAEGDFAKKE